MLHFVRFFFFNSRYFRRGATMTRAQGAIISSYASDYRVPTNIYTGTKTKHSSSVNFISNRALNQH